MMKQQIQIIKSKMHHAKQGGYILPTVIVLGLGIATVGVTAMRAVTDGSNRLMSQYYDVLAREAAQSGVAAVKACVLGESAAWAETAATQISGTRPLTPITDCDGATDPLRSSNTVSGSSTTDYETTYRVTKIEKTPSSTTIYVTSVGEAHIKSGSQVVSTVTATVRAMATSIKPMSGPVSKDISKVSVNGSTACALTNPPDSWVYCWGNNSNLQLGTGRIPPTTVYTYPVGGGHNKPIAVASNDTALSAISQSGCTNGFPGCFGGTYRQPSVPAEPVSAMQGKAVTKLSVGRTHVCAVATDAGGTSGKAYCWGKNTYGQLGNQSTTDSIVPVRVDDTAATSALFGKTVVDVVAGDNFTCAKTSDGDISCWGLNDKGQLGTDNRTNSSMPTTISRHLFEAAVPRYCTGYWGWPIAHVCRFWNIPEAIPAKPASALIGKQIKSLAKLKGQVGTMCVITMDDKTVCWGENFAGQVGNGSTLPPSGSGSGNDRHNNNGQCAITNANASAEAIRNAEANINVRAYDVLRPAEVVTARVFESVSVVGGEIDDMSYVDVIGKTSTGASSDPDRLFNWGGTTARNVSVTCINNGGTYGSDSTTSNANASISFVGRSTPSVAPLYNQATNAPLNTRLGLTSGNPVRGVFCATVLSMNQPYCDSHNGTANQGQLGNNYYCNPGWKTGSNGFPYYDNCDNRWATPQSVRTDIASDPNGPANPTNISSRAISSIDSSELGFTCMTAQASAWCWGIGSSGQLGDGANDNRLVPTAVNYSDSAIRVDGMSSGDPASWENPLWF